MHEHNNCEHELKYCRVCDVVYCEKCRREWKKDGYTYFYPQTTWAYPQTTTGSYTISNQTKCASSGCNMHSH